MRFPLIFLVLILTFLFSCKSETEKIAEKKISRELIIDSTLNQFQKELLKDQIDSVFSKYRFNGSVAVFQDSIELYRKASGFEDFKKEIPLNGNSVFAIASISKQFTAVLVLLMEEERKLSTDDKVSKYLEEFQTRQFENITIKQLLNHTSGISDFGGGLLSKPGTEFHYSNKGFGFLGKIIEKVSGKSYDENAKNLFAKLGMNNTSTANLFTGDHFASAYTGNSTKFQEVRNMPKRLAASEISIPAGGILTTVNDLHRWNILLFSNQIVNSTSLKKMLERSSDRKHPVFGEMGYGFGIMMTKENPQSYYHSGYVKGAPSLNVFYPETKTSLIILSNSAQESIGKNAIFKPHKEIKKITDSIQNNIGKLRNEISEEILSKENGLTKK